jgi:hypothetical protein
MRSVVMLLHLFRGLATQPIGPIGFAYALFREVSHLLHLLSWDFSSVTLPIRSNLERSRVERFPISSFGLHR